MILRRRRGHEQLSPYELVFVAVVRQAVDTSSSVHRLVCVAMCIPPLSSARVRFACAEDALAKCSYHHRVIPTRGEQPHLTVRSADAPSQGLVRGDCSRSPPSRFTAIV